MSENMQTLLRDALLNNSFDYSSMHERLSKTWQNSFSYLYEKQKSLVEYEEHFYQSDDVTSRIPNKAGTLHLDKFNNAYTNIDFDLITVGNREEYRRSSFYDNEFTFLDMVENPSIFSKLPILLIDNQLIWDYKLRIFKDYTTIKLPFKRNFVVEKFRNPVTDDVIYKDHFINFLVVDNVYYDRLILNKYSAGFNRENGTITIRKDLISKLNLCKGGLMCGSIHFPNSAGRDYELGSSLLDFEETDEGFVSKLPKNLVKDIFTTLTDFYVSIVYIKDLNKHTFYTNKDVAVSDGTNANIMVLEKEAGVPYSMPIPTENLIVLKKGVNEDDFHIIKNSVNVKLSYPNIYRITDAEMEYQDEYKILFFYHPDDGTLKYTPVHDFYYAYLNIHYKLPLEEIVDKIIRNVMVDSDYNAEELNEFRQTFFKILRYEYYHYKYGEIDFLDRFTEIDNHIDDTPWEYKDYTLREWIRVEPDTLRKYVYEQNKVGTSYHLFTNTLDLQTRIRMNTNTELGENKNINFNEPRYVFAMANDKEYPKLLDCRVYVDGLMVMDLIQERKLFMDYFYIPVSMVTDDSYIEMEILPTYEFTQEFKFTSMDDEKTITLVEPEENIYPTVADVFYLDKSYNTPTRYTSEIVDIISHYDRGDFPVKTVDENKPVEFTRLNTFTLKPSPLANDVLNRPLELCISKRPFSVEIRMDEEGFPFIELHQAYFNFNIEYLRVFKNGRLLHRNQYVFSLRGGYPTVRVVNFCKEGDVIYVDVTPYRYKPIYQLNELVEGELFIDLKGIINKPFDIRYYDVYLNGRRLSLNNVMHMDPWSLTLVNLKSIYNLWIFEKERDYEFFSLDYNEDIFYFSIEDLLEKKFMTEEEKNELIKYLIDKQKDHRLNIYPNTNEEDRESIEDNRDIVLFYIFYYDELIPKHYVNPDVKQFNTDIMQGEFTAVYDSFMVDPTSDSRNNSENNRRSKYPDVLCLNPDMTYRLEETEEEKEMAVYVVGHPDEDISNKILSEDIEIKGDYPINEGGV